jgi:membrane protein implicated in regulation of membrane protease activity
MSAAQSCVPCASVGSVTGKVVAFLVLSIVLIGVLTFLVARKTEEKEKDDDDDDDDDAAQPPKRRR